MANPNKNNAPLGATLSNEKTATVVDPRHPLFGRTFPLLGITTKQYLGVCCIILLQKDIERCVPLSATDHSTEPISIYPLPLSLSSVQSLLQAIKRINLPVREGNNHERGGGTSNGGAPDTAVTTVASTEGQCGRGRSGVRTVKPRTKAGCLSGHHRGRLQPDRRSNQEQDRARRL